MKGHLFVVNENSRRIIAEKGIFGVFEEDKTKALAKKTKADIFADLGCLRVGDRVFLYNTGDTSFWGIYQVASPPFEDHADIGFRGDDGEEKPAPYRVRLNPFLPLEAPVAENDLFSRRDAAREFRSIFFKKVLNRGKVCNHLFPEETEALTQILLRQNDRIPDAGGDFWKGKPPPRELLAPPLEVTRDGALAYEKQLEAWLTFNLDKKEQCRVFLGDLADIAMFANYVPITISGGNLDLVVYHEKKINGEAAHYKTSLIELKRGKAEIDALREIEKYAIWFLENITGLADGRIIQPIIIAHAFADEVRRACRYWNLPTRPPLLVRYAVSGGDLTFAAEGEKDTLNLGEAG